MSFITNLNQQQRKRLHQITLVATFGGLLFGYDTGVINGAFSSLKQYMALTPTTEGLVMSVLLARTNRDPFIFTPGACRYSADR